ncbi:MAG: putative NUDIX hydrolase [Syntrophus sp. PtaB.Bin001]|nr:MAG: putative NUDIX hydrolase [Syntrophus sp. PtaB.Bin001]
MNFSITENVKTTSIQKDEFHRQVEDKLRNTPIDFADKLACIKRTWSEQKKHLAAGVFLLLQYGNQSSASNKEPVFLLIKRSSTVSQSGDISCPGGMLNPFVDTLISLVGFVPLLPLFKAETLSYSRMRDNRTFRTILLFLANAARESWEEIGLSPFNVSFLGALPTYSLQIFRRTIFPVVGFINHPWQYKPNSEVDKILEIPVNAFFDPENYGRFYIESRNSESIKDYSSSYFPCLIFKHDGEEEILWGATFNIITNFLSIVFERSLPLLNDKARTVSKICPANYLKGSSR